MLVVLQEAKQRSKGMVLTDLFIETGQNVRSKYCFSNLATKFDQILKCSKQICFFFKLPKV